MLFNFRSILYVSLLPSWAAAGVAKVTPELSLGMTTSTVGSDSEFGGIEPIMKWTAKGNAADIDMEGGVTFQAQEVNQMPYSLWGKVKKTVSGWNLSAKVDSTSKDLSKWGVDLQAATTSTAFQVQAKVSVDASAKSSIAKCKADWKLCKVKMSQKAKLGGTAWAVSPCYDVQSGQPDVSVSCGVQNTIVTVDANPDGQKVTVSQKLGDNNFLKPSVTNAGDVELEYSRTLPTGGSLTATVQPYIETGAMALEYNDGPWSATAKAPLSRLTDVQLNIRRTVAAF